MKKIPKTNIHIGITEYLLALDINKKDRDKVRETLMNSLNMLFSLKEPVDPLILDNVLANLLAYIVSNGKDNEAEKFNHLSRVVLKTKLILEMVEQTPLATVLDYIHKKRKHPLTNAMR